MTEVKAEFVSELFPSHAVFENLVAEFEETPQLERRERAKRSVLGRIETGLGALGQEGSKALHALIRTIEPEIAIETGVLNGYSTTVILYAMERNEVGTLHSIDYPVYAGEEFRGTTNARIPPGQDPGWLVPEDFEHRWDLRLGKSQRQLPELIIQFDSIDFFFHDSEHSAPCMMFEYEMAWEWLESGGVILSDDINDNDSFETFVRTREPTAHGNVTDGIGFIRK